MADYLNRYKTLWKQEKLLITSNFSCSCSVLKKKMYCKHVKKDCLEKVNPLPDDKVLDWSKLKQILKCT